MRRAILFIITALVLLLGILVCNQYFYDPGSDEPGLTAAEMAAQTEKGNYLVRAGDCMACHTDRGGSAFAGGREIPTPFGKLYSPNITPDFVSGIGSWTANDFWRALHNGKSKDGHFLYPAFPYPDYTKVTRADADAMFSYLKTLPPVRQANRKHELKFPFGYRVMLAGWRSLFFRPGSYQNDQYQSAEWNRGAYLVQGLGHCAACHTSRNSLGATEHGVGLEGSLIPVLGWYAPSLTSDTDAGLGKWDRQQIVELLKTGISQQGTVFGPMSMVVRNSLQYLSNEDVSDIATYLKSLPQTVEQYADTSLTVDEGNAKAIMQLGSKLYDDHCASCHQENGAGVVQAYPPLAGNRAINMPSSVNTIRMVLNGGFPPGTKGNPRPYGMPPYGAFLSDTDVAAVASYIRRSWGNHASLVSPQTVSQYRTVPVE
jgi:mono/diheme cytochrome c family protein